MTRVLLTVSGVVPDSLDDDIAAGRRPRVDYRAMAAASGFEVFDERQGLAASRLGRLVARVAGAHVGSSIALYRASRDVDVVLTDAECTGLPLAVWFRLDVVARLRRRRRPRHVMISHRLAWGRKITLHRLLRLDRQIDAYIVYATEQRRRLESYRGQHRLRLVRLQGHVLGAARLALHRAEQLDLDARRAARALDDAMHHTATGSIVATMPYASPEAINGNTLPRITPLSVNRLTRLPSAKRLDQQPTGARVRRPLSLIARTAAPMVSRWAETARSGLFFWPLRVARMVPRRVISNGMPSSSRRSAT